MPFAQLTENICVKCLHDFTEKINTFKIDTNALQTLPILRLGLYLKYSVYKFSNLINTVLRKFLVSGKNRSNESINP